MKYYFKILGELHEGLFQISHFLLPFLLIYYHHLLFLISLRIRRYVVSITEKSKSRASYLRLKTIEKHLDKVVVQIENKFGLEPEMFTLGFQVINNCLHHNTTSIIQTRKIFTHGKITLLEVEFRNISVKKSN